MDSQPSDEAPAKWLLYCGVTQIVQEQGRYLADLCPTRKFELKLLKVLAELNPEQREI